MLSCSRPSRLRALGSALGLAALGLGLLAPARAQTAVLTQNNDNARTGANRAEATLTPAAVAGGHFGKLFTISGLNANVNGQVLYAPSVPVGGALHNVLYAYTSNNTDHSPCGLYAYDADTGAPLWHTLLPASATYTTATPVIDPAADTLYVLTKTDNDDTGQTFLRAFDITNGVERPGSPVRIGAAAPGTGDGSVNGVVAFDGPATGGRFHANDRAALLLLNGVVYTSYAHNSDSFPYHGWIIGYHYDGTKFTQTARFCTTPNGGDGGIWQAGKGLTADANGYLYCSVGNGTFDANTGGPDYGMCYLKLRASDLFVVDWFAPFDEATQSNQDLDLGNSGLVAIPGTTRLFGGATKFGTGFLLDSTNLGHFTPNGPDKAVQRLDGLTGDDSVGQNPVAWAASAAKYVYLWAGGSNLEQFSLDPASGAFSPAGAFRETRGLTSGGSLAVSSAGGSGGILWAVGNDNVVRAFDATDVSKPPLWTSALNSSRDALPSVGHFQFPTVVNTRVYVPTGSASIAVYGLLTPPSAHTHVLWNNSDGKVMLWSIAQDGTHTQNTFGPYTDGSPNTPWHAAALATGPDGKSHILWNNPDGHVILWTVDDNGGFTYAAYGPYTDGAPNTPWSAKALSVGADNLVHLLWTNPDGRVILWNVDTSFNFTLAAFGPYTDGSADTPWDATAIATGPDNVSRLVWNNPDGNVILWNVDNGFNFTYHLFGPYTDGSPSTPWSATAVSVGPDNVTHLLWNNPDNHVILWNVDGSFNFTDAVYGPYTDGSPATPWSATALATGPDNMSHLLWTNPDNKVILWGVDSAFDFTNTVYGPYTDGAAQNVWSATAVSAGP